ncbi:hypothetical protein PHYBOEH_009872 [Phytophthora boehmeriae]|uniref:RxLR effector protein n=1 Tax=Phytophthora boehmeriae TaxID=109152 RepID=A0A8T1VQ93_9STRA|nr:hypothetical protein PHYBOEH_009872 [Phytophthora boehmeriae]
MHLFNILLVAIVTFAGTNQTFAAVTNSKVLTADLRDISDGALIAVSTDTNGAKHLRTTKIADEVDDSFVDITNSTNSLDTEERAADVASILSSVGMKLKRLWWLQFGTSENAVKKALGLQGLTGKQLTSHKNFQHFEWVRFRREEDKLYQWLREIPPLPTYGVWEKLGLDKMVLRNMPLKEIKKTAEYATYARYLKKFDKFVMIKRNTIHPARNQIPRSATTTEMTAKAELWAANKMTSEYVLYALGLDKLKGQALTAHGDYKYYLMFLEFTKQKHN